MGKKMSESSKDHTAWNKGKTLSEETKRKISKSLRSYFVFKETRKNRRAFYETLD